MTKSKEQWVQEADDAEQSGNLLAAIECLQQVSILDPSDTRIWVRLGRLCNAEEQYSASIRYFELALRLDGSLAGAYAGLAAALEATGKLHEAEAALRRSLELRPSAPRQVLLGDLQMGLNRESEAQKSFREALRLEPDNEEALFNLALLTRQKDPAQTHELLRRVIEIDPLFAPAYRELGFESARTGSFEDAESLLRASLTLEPDNAWSHVYLGNVLWSLSRPADAEVEFKRASEIEPLWSVPYWLLGTVQESSGQPGEAERSYRRAVETDPTDSDAAFHLGQLLASKGARTEALEWLERALAAKPDHRRAEEARSMILKAEGSD